MKMKRGKRGAARSKFTALRPAATAADGDNGRRRQRRGGRGQRRSDHETAGRRKWPNGVKKCGFAALPDDVQTSPFARPLPRAGKRTHPPGRRHPFFKILLGAGRPMKRPTAPTSRPPPFPFLRFLLGAGRPMKRPTAPRFPAVAKTFFKISLGVGRPMKRPTAPHFPAVAKTFFKIS